MDREGTGQGITNASFVVPFLYHTGKEFKSEAWTYPTEQTKAKIPQIVLDGISRKLYRSMPYDYLVYVTSGSVKVDLGDQSMAAGRGTVVHIPAGRLHRLESLELPMSYTWVHYRLLMPSEHIGSSYNQDYYALKEQTVRLEERTLELPVFTQPGNFSLIGKLLNACIEEVMMENPGWEVASRAYFQTVLMELYRERFNTDLSFEPHIDDKNIKKAVDYIHLFFSAKITVEQLARLVNLNPNYFISRFKDSTGCTPVEYISRIRINHAKKMIRMGDLSLTEISLLIGFDNLSYFSRVFKKLTGVSPKEFKMMQV